MNGMDFSTLWRARIHTDQNVSSTLSVKARSVCSFVHCLNMQRSPVDRSLLNASKTDDFSAVIRFCTQPLWFYAWWLLMSFACCCFFSLFIFILSFMYIFRLIFFSSSQQNKEKPLFVCWMLLAEHLQIRKNRNILRSFAFLAHSYIHIVCIFSLSSQSYSANFSILLWRSHANRMSVRSNQLASTT